jgi:hypothetical protein
MNNTVKNKIQHGHASSSRPWALWCVIACLVHEATFTFFEQLFITLPGVGSVNLYDALLLLLVFEALRLYTNQPVGSWDKLLAIMIPLWLLISGMFNVATNVVSAQLFLRHSARVALTWCIFPVVWHMQQDHRRILLKATYITAFAVCSLHLYISFAGRSDLITAWYYGYSRSHANPNYHLLLRRLESSYVTAWPSGGLLMSSLAVAGLWKIFTSDTRRKRIPWLVGTMTAGIAIMASLSRARILVCFVAAPLLIATKIRRRLGTFLITGAATVAAFVMTAQLIMLHNPELRKRIDDEWMTFWGEFDSSESVRIQDNKAALRELGDVWIFGKTSIQLANPSTPFGSDVHGALSLILYGGMPLCLLSIAFLVRTSYVDHGAKTQFAEWYVVVSIFLLWLSNTEPLFFSARTLVPFLIFSGALCGGHRERIQPIRGNTAHAQ